MQGLIRNYKENIGGMWCAVMPHIIGEKQTFFRWVWKCVLTCWAKVFTRQNLCGAYFTPFSSVSVVGIEKGKFLLRSYVVERCSRRFLFLVQSEIKWKLKYWRHRFFCWSDIYFQDFNLVSNSILILSLYLI